MFRYGEPESHKKAKNIVTFVLKKFGYCIRQEYPIRVGPDYVHGYDVAGFLKDDTIQVDEVKHLGLTTEYYCKARVEAVIQMKDGDLLRFAGKQKLDRKCMIVVEVDDPDLHAQKQQRINDGVAMSRAKELFNPNLVFIRLNKDEINGAPALREQYFRKYFYPELAV
jgi:hypothetical protein